MFKCWQELASYLSDFESDVYEVAEKRGMTYEDMLFYLLSRLRTKPEEDFGNDPE